MRTPKPRLAHWKRLPLSWGLAVLSVAALPGAWYGWSLERQSAHELQQALQREAVMAPLEKQVSDHLASWKSVQAKVTSAQEKMKSLGEMPDQWSHRTITIDNKRMSRVEVERYLRDLGNDGRNVLMPTSINIQTAKPGESVFTSHKGQDSAEALMVTIKAELYTKGGS